MKSLKQLFNRKPPTPTGGTFNVQPNKQSVRPQETPAITPATKIKFYEELALQVAKSLGYGQPAAGSDKFKKPSLHIQI